MKKPYLKIPIRFSSGFSLLTKKGFEKAVTESEKNTQIINPEPGPVFPCTGISNAMELTQENLEKILDYVDRLTRGEVQTKPATD